MKTTNKNIWPQLFFIVLTLLFACFAARAATPAGYSVLETITYSYDDSGNRIARGATVSGAPETPIDAQYDAGNRLTQLTLKGQGPNGTDLACSLTYDPNGNLSTKTCGADTTQYTWGARNRLTGIQSPTTNASFKYDALGRRIERTVNGDTLQYLYDGDQAIAEIRNGAVSAHILTGLAIDEVIARYTTAGERTLLTDALGSVLITTKEDTTVATAYGYSSYGETQVMGTDEQDAIQYTARENDDTGLYYYRARYYDPQLKRFISEDPIGIAGGLNLYAYVNGNPISLADPSGQFGEGWILEEMILRIKIASGLGGGAVTLSETPPDCGCNDSAVPILLSFAKGGGDWTSAYILSSAGGSTAMIGGMGVTLAGVGGYEIGNGVNMTINRYVFACKSSLGSKIYDLFH